MTLEIEQRIGELYQGLKELSPAFVDWKVICHPDMFKILGLHPGDLITEYKIPVDINSHIQETALIKNNYYQSDIWIIGKPRQRRKFRHYDK